MCYRRCGGYVVVALLAFVSVLCAQDSLPKAKPDDMTVAAYELAKKQVYAAVQKAAKLHKPFLDEEKVIADLATPWKMNQQVTIRVNRRQLYRPETGRLSEINSRNVYLGSRSFAMVSIHPDDRLRLKYVGKPNLLKTYIESRKRDLKKRVDMWIRNEIDSRVEALGYTSKFLASVVVMSGSFWYKEGLGDGGNIRVSITEYNSKCEHSKNFVDVRLKYLGQEKFAAILMVGDKPISAVGARDGKGSVLDLKWPPEGVTFRVPREVIFGKGGKASKAFRKGVVIRCMKRHVGQWELKGRLAGRPVPGRVDKVICPECWGAKESCPPPSVDLHAKAKELLEGAQASLKLQIEVAELVNKYGKKPRAGLTVPCTYCGAEGKVELTNGPGRSLRYDFAFNLNLKKSPEDFTMKAAAEYAKLFDVAEARAKDVDKEEKVFTQGIADKRYKAREKEAFAELQKLVGGYKVAIAGKLYNELELINWKEPDEIANGKIATGRVDLKNSGKRGHKPKKLFGLAVRRMTEWQKISNFQPIGRLIRNDYVVNLAHFRILEIGGDPIVKDKPKEGEDEGGANTRRPPANRRPPRRDYEEELDEGYNRRTPTRDREVDESRGLRRKKPVDNRIEGKDGIEDVEVEIPKDLLKRKYVIQYAATIATGSRAAQYLVDVTFTANFKENPAFKLQAKEKKLTLKTTHTLRAQWDGDMLGAKLLTLNQLLADISGKDAIGLDVTVKTK